MEKEFEKFSPDTSILIYHGNNRDSHRIPNYRVVITTYETVLNDIDKLKDFEFSNLIIDEAQNLKNPRTKTYIAVKKIKAKTRFILTGTPLENNIWEYWSLMKL